MSTGFLWGMLVAMVGLLPLFADGQALPPSLTQFEQAKKDCADHGGLVHAEQVLNLTRPSRLDAVCRNGVKVSWTLERQ